MFANIFTTNEKYSVLNRENFREPFQFQLFKNEKIFSEFIYAFMKCRLNFERFRKKTTLIADVFPKLRTPKTLLIKSLKNLKM